MCFGASFFWSVDIEFLTAPNYARYDEIDVVGETPQGLLPGAGRLVVALDDDLSNVPHKLVPAESLDELFKCSHVFWCGVQSGRWIGNVQRSLDHDWSRNILNFVTSATLRKPLLHFTLMSNRYLVIVQAPDCFQHSPNAFVVNEFLLGGWLKGVAAAGPRITLNDEVTADVADKLADALGRMETTTQDQLHDSLCGDPGGGLRAFCDFLRGGAFRVVDGETTRPEELV